MRKYLILLLLAIMPFLKAQYIQESLSHDVGINVTESYHFSDASLHIKAKPNQYYNNVGGEQLLFLQTENGDVADNFRIFNLLGNSYNFTPALMGSSWNGPHAGLYLASNTNTNYDIESGAPMMIFAALRNYAPNTSQESGSIGDNVQNRTLFQWRNSNNKLMTMNAEGFLGLGTENPTASFHTTSTLRFDNLTFGKTKYLLGMDNDGNVYKTVNRSALNSGCNRINYILKNNLGNNRCSQIYDDTENVGIGTNTPSSKLTVNGNIQSLTSTFLSDGRFKKDVRTLDNGLDIINSITPITYKWDKKSHIALAFDDKMHAGVIAQDMQKVLPHIVKESSNNELSVNYTELIPYLINSIQVLSKEIETLKANEPVNLDNNINIAEDNKVMVVPNPTEGVITLNFEDKSTADLSFNLYNAEGKMVQFNNIQSGITKETITLENINSGVYFYNLIGHNFFYAGKLIVK